MLIWEGANYKWTAVVVDKFSSLRFPIRREISIRDLTFD